jgi:hypothetical protein
MSEQQETPSSLPTVGEVAASRSRRGSLDELKEMLDSAKFDPNNSQLNEAFQRRASLSKRNVIRRRSSLGAVDEAVAGWNKAQEAKNRALIEAEKNRQDESLEAFQLKLQADRERAHLIPQKVDAGPVEGLSEEARLAAAASRGRRGSLVKLAEEHKRKSVDRGNSSPASAVRAALPVAK